MTAPQQAAPVDMLEPAFAARRAGIDLTPATPRLRQSIARVFADFAQMATSESERTYCIALAEKWSAP